MIRLKKKDMSRHVCSGCVLLALAAAFPAQAAMSWRSVPEVAAHEAGEGGHGHGHGQRRTGAWLRDGTGADIGLWTPTLEQRPLAPAKPDGQVSVRPSGMDNYHLLVARRTSAEREEVALRYVYMRGKPSGQSPRRLLEAPKAVLEIVPNPLPREHWRYQTSAPAVFTVRYDGKPLAGQTVHLVTTHGTLLEAMTDVEGEVTFHLPEDFPHVAPSREANAAAEFIVSTEYMHGGVRRLTTLSAEYHPSPSHWQSSLGGVLALMVGFAGGVVLWRRLPTEGRST
ncbi:MAG: hypothetical protein AB7U81_09370 [Thiohalomonadaceae bacterium]